MVPVWRYALTYAPLAALPSVLRLAFMASTGRPVPSYILLPLLVAHTLLFTGLGSRRMSDNIEKFGYLDGDVPRDSIPEAIAGLIVTEYTDAVVMRLLALFLATFHAHELPTFSFWAPLQLLVFTVLVDFFYYWAHRATHESPLLWPLHRRHHTTKHPIAFLAGYADSLQHVFDVVGAPFLAYLLYPLPFDTLYMFSLFYLAFEAAGHSGVRVYYTSALTGFFFPTWLNITIEDHDIHHRYGWGISFNYGKQTVLWDHLFGTRGTRFEMHKKNVDWGHHVAA